MKLTCCLDFRPMSHVSNMCNLGTNFSGSLTLRLSPRDVKTQIRQSGFPGGLSSSRMSGPPQFPRLWLLFVSLHAGRVSRFGRLNWLFFLLVSLLMQPKAGLRNDALAGFRPTTAPVASEKADWCVGRSARTCSISDGSGPFGPFKRIVVFQTLLSMLSQQKGGQVLQQANTQKGKQTRCTYVRTQEQPNLWSLLACLLACVHDCLPVSPSCMCVF